MAHIPWMRENNPRIHRLSVSAVVALMLLMGVASAKEPSTGKKWTVPKLGMKFVWIPAMKCWVGKYEVSNREYRAFKPKHSTKDYKGIGLDGKRQPVEYINFDEAKAYAVWLTKRERDAGRLKPGLHYRLPTGKEWMTFAQCGDDREYPWGSSWPPTYGNYAGETSEKVLDPKVSFNFFNPSVEASQIPFSVINPLTYFAGVTSKAMMMASPSPVPWRRAAATTGACTV